MDDLRVGAPIRAVRRRRGLTQAELAAIAKVSQQLIAVIEAGRLEAVSVRSLRHVGSALEIQLPFQPRWRGGEAARLLDREHARLVDAVVRVLRRAGWEALVEYTFNHFGERGAIDVAGWHAETGTLVVIEVKSRLLDLQDTLATLDRKRRLAPRLLRESHRWAAGSCSTLLVLPEGSTARRMVQRHADIFDSTMPARRQAVRRWLRRPSGVVSGVWFLSPTNQAGEKRVLRPTRRPSSTTHYSQW